MTGCKKKDEPKLEKNTETYDVNSSILQLYIVDIRSIGNVMLDIPKLHEEADSKKLLRPITVDAFLQRMKSRDPNAPPPPASVESTLKPPPASGVDAGFQVDGSQ